MKGVTWRMIASSDTVLLSFLFTGSVTAALSIGVLELFTKKILFYAHERAWINIPTLGGRKLLEGSPRRASIAKAVSWRLFGAVDTMFLATIITGDIVIAASIGGVEIFTKLILYYVHERVWSKTVWGRTKFVD